MLIDESERLGRVLYTKTGYDNVYYGYYEHDHQNHVVQDNGRRLILLLVYVETTDGHKQNAHQKLSKWMWRRVVRSL